MIIPKTFVGLVDNNLTELVQVHAGQALKFNSKFAVAFLKISLLLSWGMGKSIKIEAHAGLHCTDYFYDICLHADIRPKRLLRVCGMCACEC